MIKFRDLTKDEIEVRMGGNGQLLLYKTARVDAAILDETVGPENWQVKYYQVKNTMICSVGINVNYDKPNSEPLWIWKDDGGDDDTTMEQVKAECSDSFKRACFRWNIGRTNLYGGPKIRCPEKYVSTKANPIFYDVSEIAYDNTGKISKIVITTNWGKDIVYSYEKGKSQSKATTTTTKAPQQKDVLKEALKDIGDTFESIKEEDKKWLVEYIGKLDADKYVNFFNWLKNNFNKESIGDLTANEGTIICSRLGKK